MSLADELERAAAAASAYGAVRGVLPAEPAHAERAYLIALGEDDERAWVVLGESLQPIVERERVREVASIVVLCELAVELAGAGEPDELARTLEEASAGAPVRLAAVRAAAAELESVIGAPPRVASPAYLDRVGAATRRLEQELGERASPHARALAAHLGSVEAFISEVEDRHRLQLR